MPSWWGKFTSKMAKKEKKDKIIQPKLKNMPSTPLSPSRFIFCCEHFEEKPDAQSLSLPLSSLHLPSASHVNSGINATSELGGTRGSKPSLVSNSEEPTCNDGDIDSASISSDGSYSDIIIDDPLTLMVDPLNPIAHDCKNGNKTTMHSPVRVARNDKSLATTHKSSIPSTKLSPQLYNNDLLPKLSKRDVANLPNLQIPHPGGFWSPAHSSKPSSSRSPMRRTFGPHEQVLNAGFNTTKPYPDIASRHYSSQRSDHNNRHDLVGGGSQRHVFWPQNRCNPESSPITSPGKTSSKLNSRIQSSANTNLHPLATHNGCLFPTAYYAMETSSPSSPGSGILTGASKWKKGKFLGQGSFGQVFVGFNSDSGLMCAMKEVTLCPDEVKSTESAKQLRQEVALLSHLQHPNIVRYYGSDTVGDKLYIYLEYAAGGSVYKLLQDYGQLGEDAIRSYTGQILSGLTYLHSKDVVHRDIKGANILMDPNGTVKLADFGMAKHIRGESSPFSFKGSPHWMAPEVIKNPSGCNLAVDIWSLGCTVLEMATTKPPWSQHEGVAALYKLGNTDDLPAIPDYLSKEGKDFLHLCFQRDPTRRPSAAQLLLHPFVKNISLEKHIMDIGPEKLDYSCLDSKAVDIYLSRSLRVSPVSSDVHSSRNISCPVSPIKSPDLPSRSLLHASGRMTPSPMWSPNIASGSSSPSLRTSDSGAISFYQTKHAIYSPHMASSSSSPSPRTRDTSAISFHRANRQISIPPSAYGSSSPHTYGSSGAMLLHQKNQPTFSCEASGVIQMPQNVSRTAAFGSSSLSPRTGGSDAIPYHQRKQPTYSYEHLGVIQRNQNSLLTLPNSYALKDTTSFHNDILGNDNRKKTIQGVDPTLHDDKSCLPDHVPQLQLKG